MLLRRRRRSTVSAAFDSLLHAQRNNQELINRTEKALGARGDLAESVRTNVLAATHELHELLDEVGWKPWKRAGYGRVTSRQRYIEEVTDVLLFTLNLLLLQGVTGDEIAKALERKLQVNRDRQRKGY